MRNKPNFPCAFVRLKNRFCNELPSRAEGAFDALRVLFCKAVIYFLLMPTITMNPKSFWNRIRVFNIPTFFEKSFYTTLLVNEWDENVRKHDGEKVRDDAFKHHYDFEPIVQVPKISRSISTLYSRMSQMQNGQLDGTTTAKSFLDLNWPSTTGTKALSNRICAYVSDLRFSSFHRYEVMK